MTDLRPNHLARADDPELPDVPMPTGPEPQEPGENKALTSPINELESRLLRQRKVLVFGAIDDKVARGVTGRLLALAADPEPIDVYVNSPGGHVESGDTIHDIIRFVDAVGGRRGGRRCADLPGRRQGAAPLPAEYSFPAAPADGWGARPGRINIRRSRSSRCEIVSTGSSPARPVSRWKRSSATPTAITG